MGIVLKQSFKNTIFIYLGFLVGGVNTLVLYTRFLEDEYYGLVTFLLATSNLLMPLIALGVHHAIVKFFSSYLTDVEKDRFLSSVLFLPLLIAIPMGFFGNLFYEEISSYLSEENPIIKNYTFVISFLLKTQKSSNFHSHGTRKHRFSRTRQKGTSHC